MFVDREHELASLHRHLAEALAGNGQICFVAGQAGSGKTALVHHFVEQAFASNAEVALAAGSCNAQTGAGDPYLPFREALAMLTGQVTAKGAKAGGPAENDRRLRTVLVRSVQILVEVAPDLVGVLVPGGKLIGEFGKAIAEKVGWMDRLELLAEKKGLAAGAGETPAEQSRILEQYTSFVQRLSQKIPLILFLDDLQWADGASINLLFHLGRRLEYTFLQAPEGVHFGAGGAGTAHHSTSARAALAFSTRAAKPASPPAATADRTGGSWTSSSTRSSKTANRSSTSPRLSTCRSPASSRTCRPSRMGN